MIKKFLEIKNLGIFNDYRWLSDIPEFERFNIIYGWNGSGKTTLSQLFSALERGENSEYPDLKYKVETDRGEYSQGIPYSKRIRVFNTEYVTNNIDIFSCKTKPIYILGEVNKKLAKQISYDEKILRGDPDKPESLGKLKEKNLYRREIQQKQNERGKLFTDIARTISNNIQGVATRTYRKNNAEEDFSSLKNKELLSNDEQEKYILTLKQHKQDLIDEIDCGDLEDDIGALVSCANLLLESTIETLTIQRLIKNPDISQWVEKGFKLHLEKNSEICEFCNQTLPKERINELAAFFNEADKKLKADIDDLLKKIYEVYERILRIDLVDKANFYKELQSEYQSLIYEFIKAKKYLLEKLRDLEQELKLKKHHTTKSKELSLRIDILEFQSLIHEANKYIQKHNEKAKYFSDAKFEAEEKLRKHYLSEIYDEVNKYDSDIANISHKLNILDHGDPDDSNDIGIFALEKRIDENKKRISQSRFACDEINKQLEIFLGRRELVFEVDEEGYIIRRHGKIAKNLSEGEKTAISFVYFTISLRDQDFDLKNGFVIIDDPISSLDSNSLFQAYAFLINAISQAYQVFILTHNFDFLQLLLNWLRNIKNRDKAYFMIKNNIVGEGRVASIVALDELLIEYDSEYQYLFKLLYTFKPDGTIYSVYHLPNIARKVLDNFLTIMVPDKQTPYKKLKQIEFDEIKKTAIYKFTNHQSHITGKGFDPSLVSEAQNNISYLLEMIETVFPNHYAILKDSAEK